ncbi:EEIG1/EHBP1 N-terminal domain containing protein [Quillaja saponaria]|uniref:EEIG1/EHBP1 N-terminal domain containing protein n=1 Tax=Quillaja saponaria TaxID=32244 RepID=A0AAD7KTL1_QUISA|nr:EEIG1/EHBP1 N-terminal domain containing protein [Quillaja saponaria]
MVLGIRGKSRRSVSVQVHYLIHVREIKPWPPSQSLRSTQSVLLQWANGDQNSGSFTSGVGDGRIEFNYSFRLPVVFFKESSKRGTTRDIFQKNCLEFYLFEFQKDKAVRSQLLGSATINLADYGVTKETIAINTLVNCKKSFRNSTQPVLYINIQPFDPDSSISSPESSLSKEVSLDKDGNESISELLNSGNNEEAEIASFTDDDDNDGSSSDTSQIITSSDLVISAGSPPQSDKKGSEYAMDSTERVTRELILLAGAASASSLINSVGGESNHSNGSGFPSSLDVENLVNNLPSLPRTFEERVKGSDVSCKVQESNQQSDRQNIIGGNEDIVASTGKFVQVGMHSNITSFSHSEAIQEDSSRARRQNKHMQEKITSAFDLGTLNHKGRKEQQEHEREQQILGMNKHIVENELLYNFSEEETRMQPKLKSNALSFSRNSHEQQTNVLRNDKLKHLKSIELPLTSKSNFMLAEKVNTAKDTCIGSMSHAATESTDISYNKTELESKVEVLQEELREAAAVEVSLYSAVADHGGSANKVHAPARRLSRLYFHACKVGCPAKIASAAKSAVSGFVLVSKACGNDVPRLTFWLSNSILLRAIVSQGVGKLQLIACPCINNECKGSTSVKRSSKYTPLEGKKDNTVEHLYDWEDPRTFVVALEKLEAWVFSRIVESVWWQTLTPYMQSAAAKSSSSRKTRRRYDLSDQEQGNFSIDLWKRAFKDACERLCPLRVGGHDCGCLPVIARLVMEQLVLPIPAGKSNFGAGAQLKNAIGNWSRWLTDLFGIDDNDSPEDGIELDGDKSLECDTSFKAFHLLYTLSDLMMLPFEMLADISARKEVCPRFGASLIKRVLNNFVPDEFCSDPIPDAVLEALNSEVVYL